MEAQLLIDNASRPAQAGATFERRHPVTNAVVTRDVVPGATMVGIPARSTLVEVKPETRDFVPYGTPCSELFDPQTQKLELMACQLVEMQKRIAVLMEERDTKAGGPKEAPAKVPAKKREQG